MSIDIEGHTDWIGSRAYNEGLYNGARTLSSNGSPHAALRASASARSGTSKPSPSPPTTSPPDAS